MEARVNGGYTGRKMRVFDLGWAVRQGLSKVTPELTPYKSLEKNIPGRGNCQGSDPGILVCYTAEHNTLSKGQVEVEGVRGQAGSSMQPRSPPLELLIMSYLKKESAKPTRSYYFKYNGTDELGNHNTLRIDHVKG